MTISSDGPTKSRTEWASAFIRRIWRKSGPMGPAATAGAISGAISAGIGSRVVMRIIALVNTDRDGVLTDAEATAGEISFGGTMGLFILGTVAGILGGLLYVGLRRWLWVPPKWRGPAYGLVTLLTVGNLLFDTSNPDFQIFEPVLLVLALFAVLFFVNGLILAPLADRIHPEPAYISRPDVRRAAAGLIVIVCLLGLIGMIDTVRTMVDESGTCYSAAGGGNGCAVLSSDAAR